MLTKQQDYKLEKKGKSEHLESFSQNFILNASKNSISNPAQVPSAAFLKLLRCSSSAKARLSFKNKLEGKGCELDVCLTVMKSVLLGDWANESEEPDKTSFMWLRSN